MHIAKRFGVAAALTLAPLSIALTACGPTDSSNTPSPSAVASPLNGGSASAPTDTNRSAGAGGSASAPTDTNRSDSVPSTSGSASAPTDTNRGDSTPSASSSSSQ